MLWGDVEAAACSHAVHAALWRRFGLMPERFDWGARAAVRGVSFYPLRPELAESTYWLYRATRHPHYLWLGRRILRNLERFTRVRHAFLLFLLVLLFLFLPFAALSFVSPILYCRMLLQCTIYSYCTRTTSHNALLMCCTVCFTANE